MKVGATRKIIQLLESQGLADLAKPVIRKTSCEVSSSVRPTLYESFQRTLYKIFTYTTFNKQATQNTIVLDTGAALVCTLSNLRATKAQEILGLISLFGVVNAVHSMNPNDLITCYRKRKHVKEEIEASRKRNRHRNRQHGLQEMELMDEEDFIQHYKLSRFLFDHLLGQITPMLLQSKRGQQNAINSSGSVVDIKTKLAVALRYLAGGNYLDICMAYGISKNTFFSNRCGVWKTIEAIYQVTKDEIEFPYNDINKLKNLESGFANYSFQRIRGCVMAVDGWVCRTRPPYKKEVENVRCFYNRKGFYGLVVLAGCDSKGKFLMFSSKSTGSTNDCVAWEFTSLYQHVIKKNLLPPEYFIIGDEGFVNTRNFLTPYSGRCLDIYEDSFNYHLSRMRQNIERAFGILVRRWGIFSRPLSCHYDRWRLILQVTARLHNRCLDANVALLQPLVEDQLDGDTNEVYLNDKFPSNLNCYSDIDWDQEDPVHPTIIERDRRTRDQITDLLRESNVLRPSVY